MSNIVKDSIGQLEDDPFRKKTPFTADLEAATSSLLNATTDPDRTKVISDWLAKYQPCLFGRIAAKLGGLSFCFLSEANLGESDEEIREKIQADRRRWRAKAYKGDSSGFVIVALSKRICSAVPNDTMKSLARRLCYLYLGRNETDEILLEDVFLRVPGKEDGLTHWRGGVNYFCAQGDGRWWRDHRIPGGMAFSINSVGHLVKSFQVGSALKEVWEKVGLTDDAELANFKMHSLGGALVAAMQTINGAFPATSGKATYLLPADREGANPHHLECPVALPANLRNKDFCEYEGFYHTDFTLPSEYFRPDVERPPQTNAQRLDFTYLFDNNVENSAYYEIGEGIQVRALGDSSDDRLQMAEQKILRMHGQEGRVSDYPELEKVLGAAAKEQSDPT